MKKLLTAFIICCIFAICLTYPALAAQAETEETTLHIEHFDDGSYLVTTIGTTRSARASNTVSSWKAIDYYSSDDELNWSFYIYGTFTYSYGVSSTCISARCEAEIIDSTWQCSEKTATPDGASAFGRGVFDKKFLFITVNTKTVETYLTCDKYGNIT